MKKAYYYLFYTLYRWSLRMNGKEDWNVYNALLMMSLLTVINIASIFVITHYFFHYSIELPKMNHIKILPLGLGILGFHAFNIFRNKKYTAIIIQYDQDREGDRKQKTFFVVLYLISSMFLLFFFWRA